LDSLTQALTLGGNIDSVEVQVQQLSGTIDEIDESIADNSALIQQKHDAALLEISNSGSEESTGREALAAELGGKIDSLIAADISMFNLIESNAETLGKIALSKILSIVRKIYLSCFETNTYQIFSRKQSNFF
jgi:hypothetical protein